LHNHANDIWACDFLPFIDLTFRTVFVFSSWLYATSQGVTSARALDQLCVEHLAYIWLCGGVSMNYHTLSDFRVQHAQALDDLMTQGLGCCASAGAASFHRQETLEQSLCTAQRFLDTAAHGRPANAEAQSARRQAAQMRAARERVERLEASLAELPAVQATKRADARTEARVSRANSYWI
jgi:hypothetical protein